MSQNAALRAARRLPSIPSGEVVASFGDYAAAKEAVTRLSASGFPIERVAIIGSDLKSVERVTGHMTTGRAAISGVMSGVMLAMFAGCVAIIVNPSTELGSLVAMGLVAIGMGVLWSVIGFALSPAKRDFTSVMQTVASRFDLIVPPEHAAAARQGLGGAAAAPAPIPSRPAAPAPQDATWRAGRATSAGDAERAGATAVAGPAAGDDAGAPPSPAAAGLRADGAPAAAPQRRPRTYGEAQDELRRAAAAAAARPAAPARAEAPGAEQAGRAEEPAPSRGEPSARGAHRPD